MVIVDDDSADNPLARALLERGVECLHLCSRPSGLVPQSRARIYDADFGYVGDFETAIRLLRPLRPDAIAPGSCGAEAFAARLAKALGVASGVDADGTRS